MKTKIDKENEKEPPTNEQKRNGYRKMNSMKQEQKKKHENCINRQNKKSDQNEMQIIQ